MKKTVIIFMMVFCLLLFVGIYSLAKEPSRSPGELWNTSSVTVKATFVLGLSGGIAISLNKLAPGINGILLNRLDSWDEHCTDLSESWGKLRDLYTFIDEHFGAITKVMDDLYKDPANTYIPWFFLFEIACQKLKGEDVEPLLQKARKEAMLGHNK